MGALFWAHTTTRTEPPGTLELHPLLQNTLSNPSHYCFLDAQTLYPDFLIVQARATWLGHVFEMMQHPNYLT